MCLHVCRVGQIRIYAPYMTVCFSISLPKVPYIHCIYMLKANSTHVYVWACVCFFPTASCQPQLLLRVDAAGSYESKYARVNVPCVFLRVDVRPCVCVCVCVCARRQLPPRSAYARANVLVKREYK
jgi:hypothetical protein